MDMLGVLGEPGIGKSSLVAELVKGSDYRTAARPFARVMFSCGPLYLGSFRDEYPGTDALSMSAQPKVIDFLREERPEYVLWEGDRLANDAFLEASVSMGYRLHLYYLTGQNLATERRAARGSHQNETWLKGRRTKHARLAISWDALPMDAHWPPEKLVMLMDDPVAACFR
jgi:hypothetical protein